MIKRNLINTAFDEEFGKQMRFIIGPRQCGKTTAAKWFLQKYNCQNLYYNWDNRHVRDRYIEDNHFFSRDIYNVNSSWNKPVLCLDEIHKYPKWKNILKDFYDSFCNELLFIVTGSARLDMMRKSGDSLAGRYFTFRLNPFILQEFSTGNFHEPFESAQKWINNKLEKPIYRKNELEALLTFSGYPEPLISGSDRFHRKWQTDYMDRLIREDLREITNFQEMENLAILMKLLPDKVSSPLSINSLTNDLKSSFQTVSNYLNALELGYLIFRVPSYSKKIARSIKKEKKVYFYDWTRISNIGSRFENYVACELKAITELWTDAGLGNYSLYYVKNRDGKESDFLIVKDDTPYLLIEVKLSRTNIEYHHKKNSQILNVPFIQIVREEGIAEISDKHCQMSASRFFS